MTSDIHHAPIAERIDWLMALSRSHSEHFCSPEEQLARQRYLAEHDSLIIGMKCMDGRIHLPYVTQTPLGVIQPFRNLGGIFDLGWPYLGDMLTDTVTAAVREGRRVLVIITYHYSRGHRSRGCAGFDCNRDAAFEHACGIRDQMETLFGAGHQTVFPLVCGFETDEDALVLHGQGARSQQTLAVSELTAEQADTLAGRLAALYPDMPWQIQRDLLPLIEGNLRHIGEVRQVPRALAIEHREWVICLGRGFDFLHLPNVALIIGPFSPDLSHPIRQAAGIIQGNMKHGRIPDDGFLLLASAPYQEPGTQKARAGLKSRFLSEFGAEVIRQAFPELAARMVTRSAVLHWPERRLEMQP
ncbi:MAG: carboxysome shell carbonic anhydrase [Marinobacter sp.]|uniref:carboxysome shell carbonic anhydrase domain-containg protein n=1 Tax=Marinobacter sp. TaxID=50741 RepID=UPI00299DC565|nr:carboxysome shell carbonic anhydrase domain-containg protein [Marinobacter sp.]MDX1634923.1 carboxysome shell carbonic anhydrase [Marinobacter sp.]